MTSPPPGTRSNDRWAVRLAADPASVSGARRFVGDALRWWNAVDLSDDATLCVSELATNVALHARSDFMTVALGRLPNGVRIGVTDSGSIPATAVAPRPSFPGPAGSDAPLRIEDEATTGRGLAIVSMLAHAWGVDTTDDGKLIWCDLQRESENYVVEGPTLSDDDQTATPSSSLPPDWAVVRLVGCPVELSIRQDEHLDELIRELQLMRTASSTSQALAHHLQDLLSEPAHARHTGRRTAQLAWLSGAELIDVEMAMPREFGPRVLALHEAVNRADVLCEQNQMLTVASPPELRTLRRWMAHEVSHQLGDDAAPVSWADWVSANPVGVAEPDHAAG